MNKIVTIAAILCLALVASMLLTPLALAYQSGPPLNRPMDFYLATIDGGSPQTVDYSWCYDTASGEIIFNTMDTLVQFNGESTSALIGDIAHNWKEVDLTASPINSGIPITGLQFENPANQTGTAKYYFQWIIGLNNLATISFAPPYNYPMSRDDIVYSFKRTMIQDRYSGPSWMLDEPLLDNGIGLEWDYGPGGLSNLTDPVQIGEIGRLIDNAVVADPLNSSQIIFNVMFPGAYGAFIQILTQTWASIISKQWVNTIEIGTYGRPDWPGTFNATFNDWLPYHNPTISPMDSPTPITYGSGPFILTPGTPDYVNKFWAMYRNVNYWRGWPSAFPTLANTPPAGYINTFEESWAFGWATRKTMFLNGDCDFVALPSTAYINEMYQSASPPFDPPNWPLNGVRVIHPLKTLQCDAIFMTFNINPLSTFEPLGQNNVFDASNIPPDLFSNPTWGINVRRGFAEAFDYATYISTALRNEGVTPATAIIDGLAYYDSSVHGYSFNTAQAAIDFGKAVDKNGNKLVNKGMTINIYFNNGNRARTTGANILKSGLIAACSNFTVNVIGIDWGSYLTAAATHGLATYAIGWLADFPDPHDFALPFYHGGGAFAAWQNYDNTTMDALIDKGILTPDTDFTLSSPRGQVYHNIQVMAVADVPSFPMDQPVGRHFERSWVEGYYYNPIYPGGYYYNRWKWNYIPEALYNTTYGSINQPNSTYLPADLTYDGKVQIDDVSAAAKAYGAVPSNSRWMFRGDITGDRKIQIDDIAYIAKQFGKGVGAGKQLPTWAPAGLLVYITPAVQLINATQGWIYTATVVGGTAPYTYTWSNNVTGVFGGNSPTATFTTGATVPNGYKIQVSVTDSSGPAKSGESEIAYVTVNDLTVDTSPSGLGPNAWNATNPGKLNGTASDTQDFSSSVFGGTDNSSLEGGYYYQWFSNQVAGGAPVLLAGETHPTYTLSTTPADIGKTIQVYLRVTDASYLPGPAVVVFSSTVYVQVIA